MISSVHGVHMGHSRSQEHVSHGVRPAYRAKTLHYGAMNEDMKFTCVPVLHLKYLSVHIMPNLTEKVTRQCAHDYIVMCTPVHSVWSGDEKKLH